MICEIQLIIYLASQIKYSSNYQRKFLSKILTYLENNGNKVLNLQVQSILLEN